VQIAMRVSREIVQYGVIELDDTAILQDATVEAEDDGDEVVFTVRISASDILANHESDIEWDEGIGDGDIEIEEVEASS
jgi:hypothetical protein